MNPRTIYLSPGTQAIPAGADHWQVTGLVLAFTPVDYCAMLRGQPGDPNIFVTGKGVATTDGFYVDFSSSLPNGNYTLTFWIW